MGFVEFNIGILGRILHIIFCGRHVKYEILGVLNSLKQMNVAQK